MQVDFVVGSPKGLMPPHVGVRQGGQDDRYRPPGRGPGVVKEQRRRASPTSSERSAQKASAPESAAACGNPAPFRRGDRGYSSQRYAPPDPGRTVSRPAQPRSDAPPSTARVAAGRARSANQDPKLDPEEARRVVRTRRSPISCHRRNAPRTGSAGAGVDVGQSPHQLLTQNAHRRRGRDWRQSTCPAWECSGTLSLRPRQMRGGEDPPSSSRGGASRRRGRGPVDR
jgi:hypothetical protein